MIYIYMYIDIYMYVRGGGGGQRGGENGEKTSYRKGGRLKEKDRVAGAVERALSEWRKDGT